MRMLCRR